MSLKTQCLVAFGYQNTDNEIVESLKYVPFRTEVLA